MLSAVNRLLKFLGREDCKIKCLRVQDRELTQNEYRRFLDTAAGQGRERLGILAETICATGIHVSKVR